MKKLVPVILLSVLFTAPKFSATAGDDKSIWEQVIEKIEQKYEDMSEKSSSVKARGKNVAQTIRFIQPEDQVIEDYSNLKQIALVRHGEPDMKKSGKFSSEQANHYLKCYDSVCIIVPDKPFFQLQSQEEVKVFSSPLNRALTTAKYLCGPDKDITISTDFREFETSIPKRDTKLRLPIKMWTTAARVKWMLGGGKQSGIESFKDAKKRAKNAAATLDGASEENQKVLLTAHGFLNRYIRKNLEKMGWRVVKDTGSDYFGTTILVKIEDENSSEKTSRIRSLLKRL